MPKPNTEQRWENQEMITPLLGDSLFTWEYLFEAENDLLVADFGRFGGSRRWYRKSEVCSKIRRASVQAKTYATSSESTGDSKSIVYCRKNHGQDSRHNSTFLEVSQTVFHLREQAKQSAVCRKHQRQFKIRKPGCEVVCGGKGVLIRK